jgi:glycerophosphoryl diester phosphodiesterase
MSAYPSRGRPLVVGHRGLREPGAPAENTLAAIEAAAEQGADGVEIDVRLSADGVPVVAHDETLERLSGGRERRAVREMRAAELARTPLAGGAAVPPLAEVLGLCRARGLWLNVELKHDGVARGALVAATTSLLREPGAAPAVVVSSFDPRLLARVRLAAPGLPVALLVERRGAWRRRLALLARPLGAAGVHPHEALVTERALAAWRRRGLGVAAWTVNDEARMRTLAALGVDAIITDHPGRLRALLA